VTALDEERSCVEWTRPEPNADGYRFNITRQTTNGLEKENTGVEREVYPEVNRRFRRIHSAGLVGAGARPRRWILKKHHPADRDMTWTKKDGVWKKNTMRTTVEIKRRGAADYRDGGFADIEWIKRYPSQRSADLNHID